MLGKGQRQLIHISQSLISLPYINRTNTKILTYIKTSLLRALWDLLLKPLSLAAFFFSSSHFYREWELAPSLALLDESLACSWFRVQESFFLFFPWDNSRIVRFSISVTTNGLDGVKLRNVLYRTASQIKSVYLQETQSTTAEPPLACQSIIRPVVLGGSDQRSAERLLCN